MRSVMQYWEPEQPLEPKDYDMPVCPVCGEETDTYYKNKDGVIVGCEFCIETVDAWEEQKCDDCGAEFEDPAMCTYKHYPGGEFGKEMTEYQCPYCGSEYVGKADE